jgi:hypothetical protein
VIRSLTTSQHHQRILATASVLAAAAAWWLNTLDVPNGAVLASGVAYALLYGAQTGRQRHVWLAHPLRIALPCFVVFQLLLWLRCLVAAQLAEMTAYRLEYIGFEMDAAPQACAEYLLLHYPYFALLALGFTVAAGGQAPRITRRILPGRALWLAGALFIVGSTGFLLMYQRESEWPISLQYVVSAVRRFSHLAILLLCLIAVAGPAVRQRRTAAALYALGLAVSIGALIETKMRFIVLEPVLILALAYASLVTVRLSSALKLAAGVLILLAAFNLATAVKRGEEQAGLSILDTMIASADRLVTRGASFQADAMTVGSDSVQALYVERSPLILREIFGVIPFSGLVFHTPFSVRESFDMIFYWIRAQRFDAVSIFVAGLTSLRFGFGFWVALLASLAAGLAHGCVTGRATRLGIEHGWIVNQALMFPIALNGLAKGDLVGVLVRVLLFQLLLLCVAGRARAAKRVLALETGATLPARPMAAAGGR